MKKTLIFATALVLCASQLVASGANHQRCAAEDEFNKQAALNPQLRADRDALEARLQQLESANSQRNGNSTASVVRTIPCVVHIIYDDICSPVNITKEQVLSQIASLNQDFRRLNADAANTPAVWQAIGADVEIEFKLAQLDPNGNCTDGIVRVQSPLTDEANPRDLVKSVSYWNSNKYFNIWVVKAIASSGGTGTVLGYAQFPGGNATTDGVVIRSDYFGTIGTASNSGNAGRVLTHEVGHWLNLRHIWGDDSGSCSGSDFVTDTPNSADQIFGCPTFPVLDACTPAGNGIMFMNYMDYTDGSCQNIFSNGQKTRMTTALTAVRTNLYSSANLIATGTDGAAAVPCALQADFCPSSTLICAGSAVTFNDETWNGEAVSYLWDFPGGTPATSTDSMPTITYNTAGAFDVTLTVTNSAGTTFKLKQNYINVIGPPIFTPNIDSVDFEVSANFPGDGFVNNYDGGNTWVHTTTAGAGGSTSSIRIVNFTGNTAGAIDEYITPGFDISNLLSPRVRYKVAHAQRNSTTNEELRVYVSRDCGENWTLRKTSIGAALATAPISNASFVPNTTQWRDDNATLIGAFVNAPNVRFKFEHTSAAGNNVYLDDIRVTGSPQNVEEISKQNVALVAYPNPTNGLLSVTFKMLQQGNASITIEDITGRTVAAIANTELEYGIHLRNFSFEGKAKGLYFVRLQTDDITVVEKVVYE
ncbi:MAG: hypothetical protein RIQ89_2345 [Bacteroidota bacterium]|jgi:PKD repeat protein